MSLLMNDASTGLVEKESKAGVLCVHGAEQGEPLDGGV